MEGGTEAEKLLYRVQPAIESMVDVGDGRMVQQKIRESRRTH